MHTHTHIIRQGNEHDRERTHPSRVHLYQRVAGEAGTENSSVRTGTWCSHTWCVRDVRKNIHLWIWYAFEYNKGHANGNSCTATYRLQVP
jgi:hypothetical protein